jgi:hypothetical protein
MRVSKTQARAELAAALAALDLPLPNDFNSLTIAGLQERAAALRSAAGQEQEPEAVPSSNKARNAQEFAIKYAEMVRRARADRRDKEAHDAISEGPKFIARNFLAPGEQVITQGERIWLVNAKKQRTPLEETNLAW